MNSGKRRHFSGHTDTCAGRCSQLGRSGSEAYGRFLRGIASAVTGVIALLLGLVSPAVAQDTGPTPGNGSGFDLFDLRSLAVPPG